MTSVSLHYFQSKPTFLYSSPPISSLRWGKIWKEIVNKALVNRVSSTFSIFFPCLALCLNATWNELLSMSDFPFSRPPFVKVQAFSRKSCSYSTRLDLTDDYCRCLIFLFPFTIFKKLWFFIENLVYFYIKIRPDRKILIRQSTDSIVLMTFLIWAQTHYFKTR